MTHRYSTALSHIILAIIGLYCLRKYHKSTEIEMPSITFGIIALHSLLGVWRWGNPDYGYKVEKLYDLTYKLKTLLALPCLTCQICYNAGITGGFVYPCLSFIPFIACLIGHKIQYDLINLIIALNVMSCCVLAAVKENYWGITSALSYGIAHYIRLDAFNIPPEDFHNYAFCFFAYFARKSISIV